MASGPSILDKPFEPQQPGQPTGFDPAPAPPVGPLPGAVLSYSADSDPLRRTLITPEGVDLKLRLASAGQRFGALMLDLLLIVAGLIGLTLVMLALFWMSGGIGQQFVGETLAVIWLLGWFVIRSGYFVLTELGGRGATLGKRVFGIRVIARSGERLSTEAVVARNLMREIEVFLPIAGIMVAIFNSATGDAALGWAGLVWVLIFAFFLLFNKDRLRVGDLLAGTWVVEVPKRRLGSDVAQSVPQHVSIAFTTEQLDAYGVYELQTLEGVLRLAQPETMRVVAETIRNKIGYWGPGDDWEFLSAYYAAARAHMERGLLFGKRRENKFDRE